MTHTPLTGTRVTFTCLLASFFLGACSDLDIYSARSPTASFAAYRTYAHGAPENTPAGFARTALTPAVWAMVQVDVDRELAGKGYTPALAGAEPDLLVRSGSGSRAMKRDETAKVHENADWVGSRIVASYTQATLVIDLFDAHTRRLVWHGSSRRALDAPAPTAGRDAPVAEAVQGILGDLPRAAGSPSVP
jgi:hypothetical protein